eukprot:TRINITY_DN706_c4_g1_i1.p1 TRINITY_DN706_c4_g1~~TRINITY_DN706_c4_g1_i1.p1  ORF type:complete len:686 (+),score=262.68 TRINITY_DN706_c4_g1_i1:46-2058(+)
MRAHRGVARWYSTAQPQNLVEKIVQQYAVDGSGSPVSNTVRSGDFVSIKPHKVMTHDNTAAVIPKFESLADKPSVRNPDQLFFGLDHDVQNKSEKNLTKYANVEAFAKEHGVAFSPAGQGIAHQIMVENGFAFPGTLVVASDSHSNMYGGVGCLGTPVVRTDAAAIWATGQTWWTVPPVVRVELTSRLPPGCSGKDVIITLCAALSQDEVLNHAVEFGGEGAAALSIDDRLAIANMTTEWGALAGIFPADEALLGWLRKREEWAAASPLAFPQAKGIFADTHALETRIQRGELRADEGAAYAKHITLDLSTVGHSVAGPNSVKKMSSAAALEEEGVRINKAYIVSCVNSRASDIKVAADILRGKQVPEGVEFYVAPASETVRAEAEAAGDWQALLDAGAIALPAGCGPCVGLGAGLLEEGEVGISATNRNFKGRMGHPKALCYLASPAVVATSVLKGMIAAPEGAHAGAGLAVECSAQAASAEGGVVELLDGFDPSVSGNVLWCHEDNLNTDGIYAGKHTYSELAPDHMAKVAMENYDPNFQRLATAGDILVGGYNFGSGSSREQAATCLKYRGIALVIAGSFSETYKRNAFNNGLAALESPALVEYLREKLGRSAPTASSGSPLVLDFQTSIATFDGKTFAVAPLGPFAQEICLAGGLEGWVRQKLAAA